MSKPMPWEPPTRPDVPQYLFVYGDLMKERWQHFYHLKFTGHRLDFPGDVRHYRNDRAAIFDLESPNWVPGELLVCPNKAVYHKLVMMERPQYKPVRLPPLELESGEVIAPVAFEFAGDMGLFQRLPRVRQPNLGSQV